MVNPSALSTVFPASENKEVEEKKEKIDYEKAWSQVHNYISQHEALFDLRECLERGKDVENFLKDSSKMVADAEGRIEALTQTETAMRDSMEAVVEEFQGKKATAIADLNELLKQKKVHAAEVAVNLKKELSDERTELKMELTVISADLDTKKKELSSVSKELTDAISIDYLNLSEVSDTRHSVLSKMFYWVFKYYSVFVIHDSVNSLTKIYFSIHLVETSRNKS